MTSAFGRHHDETMLLIAPCIICGKVFAFNPDNVPSLWVHQRTRCPIRPDGTAIEPGEPDTAREAMCQDCTPIITAGAHAGRLVTELFPLARYDLIRRSAP